MSDEKKSVDESAGISDGGDTKGKGGEGKEPVKDPEKQPAPSNEKTFTQSDFDSRVAAEQKKLQEKYGDVEAIKKENEELKKKQKEREEAEMSELEKAKNREKELEEEKARLESENKKLHVGNLKANILSAQDFSILPQVYKDAVKGETEADIEASAKDVLAQFVKDMKAQGKDVSIPPNLASDKPTVDDSNLSVRDKINRRLKEKAGQ